MYKPPAKGTPIRQGSCPSCGNDIHWKVSAGGLVYFNCLALDENFDPCKHHERKSPAQSKRDIAAWYENGEKEIGAAKPKAKEEGENGLFF